MSKFKQKKFLLFFTIITLSVTLSLLLVGAANQGDDSPGQEAVKGEQGDPYKYVSYDIWPGETVYVAKRINENNDLEGFRAYRHLKETDRGYFIPNRTYGEAMAFKLNKPQEIIELVSCDSPEFICGDICFVDEGEQEEEYEAGKRVQYYSTIAAGGIDDPEAQCWMTEYYHGLDYSIKIDGEDYSSSLLRENSPLEFPFTGYYTCLTEDGNCESMKESEDIEVTFYYPGAAIPSYQSFFYPGNGFIPPVTSSPPYPSHHIDYESKGVQGICPDSWRIPSYYDFIQLGVLTDCVDSQYDRGLPIKPGPEYQGTPPSISCLNNLGFNFYPAKAPQGSFQTFDIFYLSNLDTSGNAISIKGATEPSSNRTQFYYSGVPVNFEEQFAIPLRCMRDLK